MLDVTELAETREARARAERLAALAQLTPGAGVDPARMGGLMDTLPMAVLVADPKRRIIVANEHLRRIWRNPQPFRSAQDWGRVEGWWADSGRPLAPGEWPLERALATGEPQPAVDIRVRRMDGSIGVVVISAAAVKDEAGEVAFGVSVAQDVTEHREAQDRLRLQHELLRHIGDSTPDAIFAKDRQGRLLYANRAILEGLGLDWGELEGLTDEDWREDRGEALEIMRHEARVMQTGETAETEETYAGRTGEHTWLLARSPLRDGTGEVLGVIGIGKDITERKRAEERAALMVQELSHRAKNTLAVVLSIARHTLSASGVAAAARETLEARILAMARAHDVLIRRDWTSAEITEVVAEALSPFEARGERVFAEGPQALVSPRTALGLSLALHELGSNASKYGALSAPGGITTLDWSLEPDGAMARMTWRERGGPPVQAPARLGFGSRLIRRALAHDAAASVEVLYEPSGVVCELRFRVEDAPEL
jgi:PAS domain S-box-containing protein